MAHQRLERLALVLRRLHSKRLVELAQRILKHLAEIRRHTTEGDRGAQIALIGPHCVEPVVDRQMHVRVVYTRAAHSRETMPYKINPPKTLHKGYRLLRGLHAH